MSSTKFFDFEELFKKITTGRTQGLPCTLGADGIHRPLTFFVGTAPIKVVVERSGKVRYGAEDLCLAFGVDPSSLDELGPEDKGEVQVLPLVTGTQEGTPAPSYLRTKIAFHEAGHVVASLVLGIPFKEVLLEDREGVVLPVESEQDIEEDCFFWLYWSQKEPRNHVPVPASVLRLMRDNTVILMAGPVAEQIKIHYSNIRRMFFTQYKDFKPGPESDLLKILENIWFLNRETFKFKAPIENFPKFTPSSDHKPGLLRTTRRGLKLR